MKLLKDLGTKYPTITSTYKKRYGLYECDKCGDSFECRVADIARGRKSCGCTERAYISDDTNMQVKFIKTLGPIYRTDISKTRTTMWTVECPKCGLHFNTGRDVALSGKVSQCVKCGNSTKDMTITRKPEVLYKEELFAVHGTDIINTTPYINALTPIEHKHSCGHIWKTRPANLLQGSSCPECSINGFKKNSPAILYYFKVTSIEDTFAWKIGVTNLTVKDRYLKSELVNIFDIVEFKLPTGGEALQLERKILTTFKHLKYQGLPLLQKGNTELFSANILKEIECMVYPSNQ